MHPNYAKKGVFTSYANQQNLANPPRKENIIINDPSQQYHLKHQHQVIHNKKNLTVEELQGARFLSQTTGYSMERPEMRFQYVKGAQQQTFVPPPPQRFLVSSGQSYSQPSSLPIHSGGQIHSVHAVQPLHQSIRRTFVPHHIYNQIPVMESQTKYYHEEVHQQQENEIDESDRKMIEQYQKLYDTYQTSQIKVEQLQRLLREQREKKQSNGSEVKQVIITKEVLVEKPKKVDIKLLSSLIIKKKKAIIDEIIERKKNSCISKLRALFSEEQSNLKTTLLRVSEQFTSTRVRTR